MSQTAHSLSPKRTQKLSETIDCARDWHQFNGSTPEGVRMLRGDTPLSLFMYSSKRSSQRHIDFERKLQKLILAIKEYGVIALRAAQNEASKSLHNLDKTERFLLKIKFYDNISSNSLSSDPCEILLLASILNTDFRYRKLLDKESGVKAAQLFYEETKDFMTRSGTLFELATLYRGVHESIDQELSKSIEIGSTNSFYTITDPIYRKILINQRSQTSLLNKKSGHEFVQRLMQQVEQGQISFDFASDLCTDACSFGVLSQQTITSMFFDKKEPFKLRVLLCKTISGFDNKLLNAYSEELIDRLTCASAQERSLASAALIGSSSGKISDAVAEKIRQLAKPSYSPVYLDLILLSSSFSSDVQRHDPVKPILDLITSEALVSAESEFQSRLNSRYRRLPAVFALKQIGIKLPLDSRLDTKQSTTNRVRIKGNRELLEQAYRERAAFLKTMQKEKGRFVESCLERALKSNFGFQRALKIQNLLSESRLERDILIKDLWNYPNERTTFHSRWPSAQFQANEVLRFNQERGLPLALAQFIEDSPAERN